MKIAICDDNKMIVNSVKNALLECNYINFQMIIEEFFSGEDLLEAYKIGKGFDLIFLDIKMDQISGIETAEKIKFLQKDVIIIFLTGYNNYVKDAFRVQAFQYLTKPVKPEEIIKEFKRAVEQYKRNHTNYRIENNERVISLEIQSILFLEVRNHIITIHTENDEHRFCGKLQEEETKLVKYDFIRCHQGFIVNMAWIQIIEKDSILLKTGKIIPISRRMRKVVMNVYSSYIIRKCI